MIRLIVSYFLWPLLTDDFHGTGPPFFIVFVDAIKFLKILLNLG